METKDLIPIHDFCVHHNIEISFILSMNKSGLVDIIHIEEKLFLPISQLSHLEKFARLHYDLDINVEGIETINHLLQTIDSLQKDIARLNERLILYENTSDN